MSLEISENANIYTTVRFTEKSGEVSGRQRMSMISSLIERLNKYRKCVYSSCSDPVKVDDLLKEAADTIEMLSKKCRGEWIEDTIWKDVYNSKYRSFECSQCGEYITLAPEENNYHFCPNCGAEMVEPQEREINNG